MVRMPARGLAAALVLAALSGCAAKPPAPIAFPSKRPTPTASHAASEIDPCSLLSREEATAALGSDPGAGRPKRAGTGGSCTFVARTTGNLVIAAITGPAATIRSRFTYSARQPANKGFKPVSGIGDGAIMRANGKGAAMLFFKGTTLVSIVLTLSPKHVPTPAASVTTLGKAAAGRV